MKYLLLVVTILAFNLIYSQETVTYYGGDNPYRYSVKEKGNLINGKRDGIWTMYYQTGICASYPKIKEKGSYVNGVKEGTWYIYEGNEEHLDKVEKVNYIHGIMVGEYLMYKYGNGETLQRGNYNNEGQKDGEWFFYSDTNYNHILLEKRVYVNGKLINKAKFINDEFIEVAPTE